MNEIEVKKLYNALIQKGYTIDQIGNENTFLNNMNDENKRRDLYEYVSSKGNFKIGDYDTYESRLTSSIEQSTNTIDQPANPVEDVKQDYTPKYKPRTEEVKEIEMMTEQGTEYATGLKQGWKQGWKGLGHGLQHLGGEVLNLFTGSTIDEEKALAKIAELERDSIDIESVIAPLDKAKKMYYNNIANPSPEVHIEATEEEIAFARQALEDDAINKTIRKYIEKAGSLEEAKSMLAERANEETLGDRRIKKATQGLAELKPTKGFGAWVGNLLPQMVPAAASMAVGAVTKNPIATQAVGGLSLVTMSASTAGMSMNEAREAGATGLQTWAVGIADGAIEFLTEKIPFDNYVSRVLTGTKRKIGGELSEAMVDSPPAREEIERLLQEANKRLGGKLFNGKNVKDFVGDIIAEGASEFTAEALQTITPMIYENPEDYPTITEIIRNGLEGAKAGVFMGSVLGGASKTMEHYQHRNRRKEQGFVSVVEFETKDGHKIGEALGMDDKGFVVVLADGKQQRVMPEDILYGHKFSFEEFDRAELQMENEESFDNGYSLSEQQEMNDAKNMLEVKKAELIRTFGLTDESDIDAFLGENPIETVAQRRQNGESEESTQTVIDYLNAKATYDGMIQRVRDDIDGQIEQSNALIDSHTNKHTGKIHGAVSKEDGRLVYIVSGNVVPYQDGSGIDLQNSDENIIVRDAETGELKQMSPEFLSSLYDTQDPNEQKEINAQQIREKILSEESNKIDGVVDFNDKAQFLNEVANQIAITMILAQRGLDADYIKTFLGNAQIVENPDGTLTFTDGQNEVVVPKQEIQQQVDANNMQRAVDFNDKTKDMRNAIEQTIPTAGSYDNNNELEEKVYQASENLRKYVEFFNYRYGYEFTSERDFYNWIARKYKTKKDIYLWLSDNLPKENVSYAMRAIIDYGIASKQLIEQSSTNKGDLTLQSTTDETVPTSQSSLIPKDESGNPIYEQADSETAWDALMEDAEGDEIMAGEVAKSMIADKEAELKKLEKTKIKEGKTPAEKMAALKERKAEVEKIKQDIEAWKKIAFVPMQRQIAQQERIRQEEAEAAAKRKADEESLLAERLEALRNKQELLNGIPDYSEDTPQNARARGYRRVNGHIEERQQPIEAVQGKETEVEFSNDVRPKGHYAVIDASQLQPSHIQGNRNPLHFLDEAQPKERNDKASIVSAQKIAGNIRPATITTGETAYVGTPTVNTRGEVIQGNSRSDALKLMYGNHNDQAQTYKQYLIDNAEQFGLNPEDVSNMESPVLVRMLDVSDEQAITLGQYVAQDTESGGVERIKPKNAVKKMGDDINSFANILLDSADEDLSFAELLDSNGVKVLKWMAQKGYITDTQYSSAFDTKGSLTAEAKNDLRGIMYQSIFEGGNTRLEEMFNALPAKAQKAILATAHRDFSSPSSESMIHEIQNSIRAFYALMQDAQFAKAKNFKEADKAADAWQKQYQMDDITGESYLPSEKFTNFALLLAKMYKGEKQSNIQSTFEELYDLIQGTKEDNLFEQADNTPRTLAQAIKEVLNIDYNGQRRSIILDSDIAPGQQGQHGSSGNVASEERTESGERTDDDSGRIETDSNERQTDAATGKTETESNSDDRTIQTIHQSGSEREGLEQTLDGRRQADSPRMDDDTAGIMETGNDRSDIRVFEEGLATSYREHSKYSERARRTAESERLVNIAKQHGLFIPAEDTNALTGKLSKRTGESVVYIDTEAGIVTKVKDPYAKSAMKSGVQPEDAVFEHLVHNLLFPETAYTFEGISEDMGDVRIVLSQSLIQSKGHPTKEQIAEALAERGLFPEDKYSFGNEFVSVTDVEGDNVILGEDGNLYFIDPIIRFKKPLKEILDNYNRNNNSTLGEQIKSAEKEVNTSPTDKQKEAGNYKKGHVQIGTFNITIEQPKGSVRSGVDANGRKWETTMHNTYGYIRGTEGVDGDHIDVFLSDDIDGWNGNNVFVVDQYNEDGTFDEHKVMLGFNTIEEAESAYLDNYEKGWEKKHKIVVSPIHTENFEKWIESSHRKTKPFAEYKSVKSEENRNNHNNKKKSVNSQGQTGSLFDDLFNNENSNDNGLQRNDEVRSEGLSADNNINTGTGSKTGNSQEVQQESGRTDGNRDGGSQRTGREIQNGNVRSSGRLQGLTEKKNTRNNRSERGQNHAPTSVDARIEANIKAIELAKRLLENGEQATKEQMEVLRKFSGWGGLGKAFNERASYVHEGRHYYNEPTVENKKIRELLGEEAYQQAENSKYSSFYTPAYIVDTLWDIAEQMGFKGGNILEGSAGIGNILGQMPAHISENSDIHAIEIDNTSGGILSLLYPDAKVEVQGFEETHITNGSVDLAITNVPFITDWHVKDTSGDKDLSRKFHNIHDFCIAKNVRKLREGGIGIFITSNGTLDSSKKLRDWIVSEGNSDFVGAFRMHNKTFGGTSVTSDIIVIRKRVNGQKSVNAIDVSTVSGERTTNFDTGETRKVKGVETSVTKQLSMDYNRYFIEHPERMAGEMHFAFEKGDTYRPTSKGLYPSQDKNQEQMLTEFVKSFTAEEFGNKASNDVEVIDAIPGRKIGEMFVKDGKLYINAIGAAQPLDVNANKVKGHTKAECFKAYSSIKDALKEVLDYQSNHESDNGLKPLLEKLNKAYDDFVSTYGHFNKNTSIAFLRNDVDYANVASVETYKETGDGKGGIKQTFGKADVLTKRVIEKEKEPTPTNVKDGIVASMFKHGRIDIQYIAEQLGKSEADVKKEIISKGYGFEDPITRQIEVSYQYLSGNVREKLLQAQENNENGEFNSNIKALQEILPMNIPAHLIDFTLGSSWIDSQLYDDYVKDRTDVEVKFTAVGGTWFMKEPYYTGYEKNRSMGVTSEMLGKTIMGHTLIEAAIQNKSITVSTTRKNWDGSTETIVDKEATQACASKIDEIRQDFKEWARQKMQSDPELSAKMERIYNDTFNNYVPVKVTDEFLPKYFAGAIHKYEMRPHQKRAIVRGTMQPLMLAHEVGSGKTFTLISTAMEMRRLGTARKPMIVVQNATVGQFVASAKELYPNAKILTLEDGDRNAEGRKNFYAKIKYNDWDMIVVPQSTFEFIPDSEEREMAFIQDKIEEKMLILEQMKNADPDGNSMITRQAEREIAMLEEELAGLSEMSSKKRTANDEKKRAVALQNAEVKAMEMLDRRTDDVENFDDMGIDALLVDEAHEYKHLGFATAMQRGVKGVDPSYSKKSQGVFLKTQAVLEKNNGRNVIFATGTPISNTAAEIWTFMRYLMPADTMKEYGIYYFDDFVRNFGNIQQMLEFTTSGKFKENNRFAGYVNLPELVRIWSGVSDTVNFEDIEDDLKKQGKDDLRPEIENGKAQDIYLPQTRALRGIMKFVKAQLDAFDQMSGKMKKENSHIPLTMYGIAKAAAVDARLVQSDAEDDPNSKTNEAVRQTLRSLKETESYKGTIAIFADNYQNKESGFNLYEDIRSKLIAEGVSSNEIAVIKSGMTVKKKLEIFEKVNRGEIRVILGSTFTLGTGVNIQERLHTLIHLDAPNRPMDYTQRNGRIQRQGNIHKEMGIPVRILRFGVEDSLDVTAYQRLKTKGAIADSIMKGKQMMSDSMTNRVLEEEEDVFGDTVAQLSGSEYAMLKNNAEKNVRKYQSRKKQWEADQTYIHNAKPRIKGLIKDAETRIELNSRNLKEVQSAFPDGKFKEITIGKKRFTSIESMEDFFKEHNKSVIADTKKIKDGEMSGNQTREVTIQIDGYSFIVKTELTKEFSSKGINMFSEVHRKMTYSCPQLGIENVPVKQALLRNGVEDIVNNIITGKDFAELLEASEHSKKHNETELEQLMSREGKPFEYEKELEQAQKQFVEYSELMKKEMAEKEAKYAEMDASVEAASDIANAEEDDVLYRDDEYKTEKILGGIWIEDKQEFAKFVSAVNNNYVFEEDGEGITYTDNHFYAYYWNIDGEPTPYIDVYLNAEESQDVVNEVSKEINHVRRGKGIKKYIDRAITRAGSSNGKNNGNHGNNTSIPHRAGNDKLGGNILRKGRYFDNPSLYVKTQRADRYNREGINSTVSSSPAPAQRRQMVEHAENLAKRLHLDNIEIVNSVSGLEGKKKSAKGFYDPKTGKITIVIPNNTSIADIEKTLLHEAVAHYGLRQLFGEHFDTFLDNVYNNVDENIRKRIAELAIRKYNYDFRKATEEYLASLAESTNFENAQQSSWWQKVKDFFADMLSKLGFKDFRGVTLTDNELRYIIWRSYENLSSKRHEGVFGQAADIAKQYELGVGDYAKSSESEDDVLFRDGDPEIHEKELVRDKYDRRIKAGWYQSKEAFQDSMLSLKEAMKDIAGMEIEDIDGFENAYLGENRLSSVNKAEADAFARLLFKPMLDEVAKLAPTAAERQELVDYMMAKHGLERNEYMRQQAMQNGEDANRDFAGLTSLTGFDDITAAEAEAQIMVNEYEQDHDTTELWDNVNAVSKAILSKSYECGLIDKDTFENISNMYEFYIPLRGFEEKTSDEAYAYLSHIHSAFNAPIKKAQGRTSKADDPFAYLQSMAESAIMQGNRNKLVKQRFLNFVLNNPSDLVSVSELWLEYDNVDDEWRPVFPDNIDTNDSGEVVEQKMKDFDEKMKLLAQNEPDRYKKGRDAIGIPYRVVKKKDLQQHQVIVKRNGRDVVLTVNGNPRLAQALNGQTNPDNDMSGAIGAVLRSGEWVNRQLSAFYTTRNPDFIVSNFLRDMLYSNSMAWFKESPNYALRFNRNYMIANPITMKRLLNKYRKGTLDTSDKIEGMFYQFMMNGGETGYTNIRDIEQHKNDIRKELRRSNGRLKIGRALSLLAERFDELNRAIENCARFAAFMTSKEMGRTTDRAIYDAKEISVNFNKKGSGSKFYGEVGQTVAGNAIALVSGLGRSGFVFWNAAIQGTTNFGRQIKRHPAKAFTGIASMFLLGALVAFLGGDDDDDDNKNSYYNLPEYVRRSNILFRAGEHWISIPLPVEYRAIYGLGELMTSTISGKEHLTDSEIAEAIIGQMSQVLPLDFMEGGGGLNALVPSAVKPVIEAYVAEKSWTGLPLYKDTPYNKNKPEWTKAYSSANKHIVNLTASLNEATGGDRYTKGNIDINPAKIEYVLKGYFGGVFNTIDKMAKMAETAAGEREYDPQNFLLLNRVVKAGDERTEYRAVNNEYQRLKKEYEILDQRLKNYERDTYKGIFDYAEKIDFIYNSPEFQRHEIFEIYKKDIKFAEEWVKQASSVHDDEGVKKAEHYLNEIKKKMIEEMNKTRKRA